MFLKSMAGVKGLPVKSDTGQPWYTPQTSTSCSLHPLYVTTGLTKKRLNSYDKLQENYPFSLLSVQLRLLIAGLTCRSVRFYYTTVDPSIIVNTAAFGTGEQNGGIE